MCDTDMPLSLIGDLWTLLTGLINDEVDDQRRKSAVVSIAEHRNFTDRTSY